MRKELATTVLAAAFVLTGCAQKARRQPSNCVERTYVHKYGVEVAPEDWSSRGQNGQVITTRSDGVVVTHSYVDGVLEGETSYTFPHNSAIEKVESYKSGTLVKTLFYDRSKNPRRQIIHEPGEVNKVTFWYEGGAPQGEEQLKGDLLVEAEYLSEHGQVEGRVAGGDGNRVNRDRYGQIASRDMIEGGRVIQRTTYHPNGAPEAAVPFVNGQVHGTVKTFYPAGEPRTVEEWRWGEQHGITIVFENGEKFAEVPYEHGKKEGIERRFRDGNRIFQEISWAGGEQHGSLRTYIGNSTQTTWFYRGKEVPKATFDLNISRDRK